MDRFENAQRQRQPIADSVGRDLRDSFRRLLRRRTFTLAAVLTLALGIGANTAVFSVVNAVLLKPLSYPQSDELVSLPHVASGLNSGALGLSPDLYFTYRDENRTFAHLGVFTDGGATVTGVGDPEQARALFASDGVLQALGVQPMLGRWFSEADHAPQAAGGPLLQLGNTVILTHAYWQRKFGGDPGVIGRTMSINSLPTEIVGVMPAGFRFLNMTPEAELILPGQFDRSRVVLAGFGNFRSIGRLKSGVTLADAQADAARMLPIWLDAWPAGGGAPRDAVANWRVAPAFVALKDTIVGNIASTLWALMGTIGAVFAI